MCGILRHFVYFVCALLWLGLTACSTMSNQTSRNKPTQPPPNLPSNYEDRLPGHINTSEKTILVDPNVHAWGAYNAEGNLIRAGLTTAGASYCPDIKRACKTKSGTFRINSLGEFECKSRIYPVGKGGAPMPYCMYFHGGQGLHGSYEVVEANVSHGCVRMRVPDAEWVRYNFANIGTKVIVRPY